MEDYFELTSYKFNKWLKYFTYVSRKMEQEVEEDDFASVNNIQVVFELQLCKI